MCAICQHSKCVPRCPNYEPAKVYHCDDCREDICEGEEYVEINGKYIHLECLKGKSLTELIELFSCTVSVAEKE